MQDFIDFISQPWEWYVAGPLVGLTVPALLVLGNKHFGISANLRHACAACFPAKIPFFNYEWKKEVWNLLFVLGAVFGGMFAFNVLADPNPISIDPNLQSELATYGLDKVSGMLPTEIFSWSALLTTKGFVFMALGGFMIGFGSRYAGGCTSGHAISGLSNLQWPSLVATCCFFVGGLIMANFLLPMLLSL